MVGKSSNWQDIWRENATRASQASDVGYWNKRAEDYNDLILTSRFDYGEEIVRILCREGGLGPSDTVLEIAGGVGAVTLPLAKVAERVVTIEPAVNMARRLEQNAQQAGISNIDLKIGTQEDSEGEIAPKSADLAILCHAAWQFPDIGKLLHFMERASRRHCCLADSIPNVDPSHLAFNEKLGIEVSTFDRISILYNMLLEEEACPDIVYFDFLMRRSIASATHMLTHVTGKYREVTRDDIELIEDYVRSHASAGIYEEPGRMGVMWWKPGFMSLAG